MFTQSAPSLFNAVGGYLPDVAVKALVQSLGNCQQSLVHRGAVTLSPPQPTNRNGVMAPGMWNPQLYQNVFPQNSSQYYYEAPNIGGYTNGNWYTTNYGGAQFSFPTNQEFAANSYYGGPTFNVGGNSFFDNTTANNATYQNLTTNNITTQNINVTTINGGSPPESGPSEIGGGGGAVSAPTISFPNLQPIMPIFGGGGGGGGGRNGRPARARVITSVSISGFCPVSTVTKAELGDDCEIKLTYEEVDVPLTLTVSTSPDYITYLAP